MTAAGGSDGKQAEEAWLRTAEQAENRAALYEQLAEQIQAISVTETFGLATVTVDATGVVTALTVTDNLRGKRGGQVAADVITAMRRAQARLSERMAALAAATVGPDDRVGTGMTEQLRDRFGGPSEETPVTEPTRSPVADDEDFGDQPIMRRNR